MCRVSCQLFWVLRRNLEWVEGMVERKAGIGSEVYLQYEVDAGNGVSECICITTDFLIFYFCALRKCTQ